MLLVVLATIASCSRVSSEKLDYRQNLKNIHGEYLETDCFVGNPYSITCADTLLIFYDRYEGKTVTLVDLKSGKCKGRFVSEGNGPEEVIVPIDIFAFPQKDKLYLFQRNTGTMNTFSLPDMKMKEKTVFGERPSEMQKTEDFYVGFGLFEEGRFIIYDRQGKRIRTAGSYPFRGEAMEPTPAFILYQGKFCASPKKNYYAISSLLCDHVSFYEIQEQETVLLKQYESYDVNAKYQDRLVINDQCTVNYTWAFGTERYCYMLYSGKTYVENGQRTDGGRYIVIFDWQGNHIETLDTDCHIRTFCVDESDRQIYALALDDEGECRIMNFQIPAR
jgi:hypothetical protein